MSTPLVGEAYIHSSEKRAFDVAVARFIMPLEISSRAVASVHTPANTERTFSQPRVGKDGDIFEILKLRTLSPDGKTPLSKLHEWYRVHGVDELLQWRNIMRDEMTVIGRRPVMPNALEDIFEVVGADLEGARLVDRYQNTVMHTKPGLLSSFAIHSHIVSPLEPEPVLRLELDIKDFEQASRKYSSALMKKGLVALLGGKLQNGSIPSAQSETDIDQSLAQ